MKSALSEADILIFEPGMIGHRLTWLRYVTEDFLEMGHKIAWAVDLRSASRGMIEERLSDLLPKVSVLSVFNEGGRWRGGSKVKALEECRSLSGAGDVFVNEFDEMASNMLRRAAVGMLPPPSLQGRLNGVYFRPRFLTEPRRPVGNILKAAGFRRLCRQGWFRHLYFVDEYLFSSLSKNHPARPFHFLPDPWSGDFSCSTEKARQALDIPMNKAVFLHYGMGDRRKGLHLAVDAMEGLAEDSRVFLLCAGNINPDPQLLGKLAALQKRGSARLMNRYVSDEEEHLCFCAADGVLLPYIHHYGSSGVLSRAAAAGKTAIVSDEGLLAKRVRDHHLGLLYQTNNSHELRQRITDVVLMNPAERDYYGKMSRKYALTCSREAFRDALTSPWRP